MGFSDFPQQRQGIELLQRSLERGRLGHGYLFSGHQLETLEGLAITLAKTLNCLNPVRKASAAIDCCDQCLACRKIQHGNHADVHWARPESKSRVITTDQMRDLMKEIQLKPTEGQWKVAIISSADRLRVEAANAFLKTLEEPPPNSVLILLTTDPERILETILSRCLRLNFGGEAIGALAPARLEWLRRFSELAAAGQKSLLGRYRLLDLVLVELSAMHERIEEQLKARSPLQQYKDAEKETLEKWEKELAAATESEYRGQRSDLLALLQWWMRDVWMRTLRVADEKVTEANRKGQPKTDGPVQARLLSFPELAETEAVAGRISRHDAAENLEVLEQMQRRLGTNVQEALALEVGFLKLRL